MGLFNRTPAQPPPQQPGLFRRLASALFGGGSPVPAAGVHLVSESDLDAFLYHKSWLPCPSWITAARYDESEHSLTWEFQGGGYVVVLGVSRGEAHSFATAPSKGVWAWDHVLVRGKGNQGRTQKVTYRVDFVAADIPGAEPEKVISPWPGDEPPDVPDEDAPWYSESNRP